MSYAPGELGSVDLEQLADAFLEAGHSHDGSSEDGEVAILCEAFLAFVVGGWHEPVFETSPLPMHRTGLPRSRTRRLLECLQIHTNHKYNITSQPI